jgi:hypothetical protein
MTAYRHSSGEAFSECAACVQLWVGGFRDEPCTKAEPDDNGDCLDCGHRVESALPVALPMTGECE